MRKLYVYMKVKLRKGSHHSGNWGGLLANPGVILANAISSMISSSGEIKIIETLCRIDTKNELEYYKNGGILQYVLRNMI